MVNNHNTFNIGRSHNKILQNRNSDITSIEVVGIVLVNWKGGPDNTYFNIGRSQYNGNQLKMTDNKYFNIGRSRNNVMWWTD